MCLTTSRSRVRPGAFLDPVAQLFCLCLPKWLSLTSVSWMRRHKGNKMCSRNVNTDISNSVKCITELPFLRFLSCDFLRFYPRKCKSQRLEIDTEITIPLRALIYRGPVFPPRRLLIVTLYGAVLFWSTKQLKFQQWPVYLYVRACMVVWMTRTHLASTPVHRIDATGDSGEGAR